MESSPPALPPRKSFRQAWEQCANKISEKNVGNFIACAGLVLLSGYIRGTFVMTLQDSGGGKEKGFTFYAPTKEKNLNKQMKCLFDLDFFFFFPLGTWPSSKFHWGWNTDGLAHKVRVRFPTDRKIWSHTVGFLLRRYLPTYLTPSFKLRKTITKIP